MPSVFWVCMCHLLQRAGEEAPTHSVSLSFDEWLRIAEDVEEKITNNQTVKELYYMKMVGSGGNSKDVSAFRSSPLRARRTSRAVFSACVAVFWFLEAAL